MQAWYSFWPRVGDNWSPIRKSQGNRYNPWEATSAGHEHYSPSLVVILFVPTHATKGRSQQNTKNANSVLPPRLRSKSCRTHNQAEPESRNEVP